jgi:hypothetical protein
MAYTTINKSTDYFNTKLYTGNGSTQSITGVGHQPDMVWTKSRGNQNNHNIYDAIRGATKRIFTNSNSAESTVSNTLTSFDSDGFSLGSQDNVNANGITMASWNWKANGSGSANTDGSINSTVSANTTSGFSIVKYTGTNGTETVGHGLGVAPKMIIIKYYSSGKNWVTYHASLGATKSMYLDETNAASTSYDYFADTEPTSTVFTVKKDSSYDETNNGSASFIAYCFADVTGYSKFGSYTGNGNADGTFVYTGFKPAFVLQKNSGYTGNWILYDNKRDVDNVADKILIPNSNSAEATACDVDLLSNGFKFRAVNNASSNWSGNNYIYMSFAEAPLVGTNNVPCTAR